MTPDDGSAVSDATAMLGPQVTLSAAPAIACDRVEFRLAAMNSEFIAGLPATAFTTTLQQQAVADAAAPAPTMPANRCFAEQGSGSGGYYRVCLDGLSPLTGYLVLFRVQTPQHGTLQLSSYFRTPACTTDAGLADAASDGG